MGNIFRGTFGNWLVARGDMRTQRRVNERPTLVDRSAGNGRLPEELLFIVLDLLPVCEAVKCRQVGYLT